MENDPIFLPDSDPESGSFSISEKSPEKWKWGMTPISAADLGLGAGINLGGEIVLFLLDFLALLPLPEDVFG